MSSKRGRKRNDELPPNRARDVQRAFRARRAAHLQALEQRVTELEEENHALRAALDLPPASRPSLGKGPTGKDRDRAVDGVSASSYQSSTQSRESSTAELDSPMSTRANSLSPTSLRPSPRSAHPMGTSGGWDEALAMREHNDIQPGSEPFHHPIISTPMPPKVVHPYTFPSPIPSTSRSSMGNMYLASQTVQPTQYPQDVERPTPNIYTSLGYISRDSRDDTGYPYSQAQFSNQENGMQIRSPTVPQHSPTVHQHSPTSNSPRYNHPPRESMSAPSSSSYSQRHPNTDSQSYRSQLAHSHSHLSAMQINSTMRTASPNGLPDSNPALRPAQSLGTLDGRIHSLP